MDIPCSATAPVVSLLQTPPGTNHCQHHSALMARVAQMPYLHRGRLVSLDSLEFCSSTRERPLPEEPCKEDITQGLQTQIFFTTSALKISIIISTVNYTVSQTHRWGKCLITRIFHHHVFQKRSKGELHQAALPQVQSGDESEKEEEQQNRTMKLFSCQAASLHLSIVSQTQSAPRTGSWICYSTILTWLLLWLCHSEAQGGCYFELQKARAGKAASFLQPLEITVEIWLQLKQQWACGERALVT